jgi:pyroglutamyl-peptidase
LEKRTLSVTYKAADQAAERILHEEWDLILLLGVRAGASHLAIERLAINRHDTVHPDTAGFIPTSATIATTGDLVRTTALPVDDLAHNLRAHGIPVTVSTDPGNYLCNYTYYQLLAREIAKPILLIHLPLTTDHVKRDERPPPALPLEFLTTALNTTLKYFACRPSTAEP